MNAPVILFVYARLEHTRKTVQALQENHISHETDLIIYSDAARNEHDKENVENVRAYLENIDGFKSIKLIKRSENYGLAKSITEGVTEVVSKYGKVIVLEDDIVTSPCFLTFMNNALNKYQNNKNIWHVSGWNYPIDANGLPDVFFWQTMNCWGWATWEDRWTHFEKNPQKLVSTWNKDKIKRFNLEGACDFWSQVTGNINGTLNTWAIFWYATIFEYGGLCLNPTVSLVDNIGNDGSGENCGCDDPYKIKLSNNLPVLIEQTHANGLAKSRIMKYYRAIKKPIHHRLFNRLKRVFK